MMGFWDYSLGVYAQPGVYASCIALQDAYGADVDLILYCLWAASAGHSLSPDALAVADGLAAPWRAAVLEPLRRARRAMKPPPAGFDPALVDALRRQTLAAELEAERVQQDALARAFSPTESGIDPAMAARDNLLRYAALAGIPPDAAPLAVLLATATS